MYIPTLRRILYSNDVNIERTLPAGGKINVTIGDKTEPFTRLGMSKISYKQMEIPSNIILHSGKTWKEFFYMGEKLGKIKNDTIVAPFDGYLVKTDAGYILKEEDKVYWLLSGVWGEVANLTDDKSVLVKTQCASINFVACTDHSMSGELIVFPNPSEILEMQYLEKFEKYAFGKIVYVGNFASSDVVQKAINLGVVGILAGSADRESLSIAKKNNVFLGLFSGFGNIPTPKTIFDILKEVSNRYVFIEGDVNSLKIPMPVRFDELMIQSNTPKNALTLVKKGLKVVVLQDPAFGGVGEVDSVKGSRIFVRLEEKPEIFEVALPNILALA